MDVVTLSNLKLSRIFPVARIIGLAISVAMPVMPF